MRGGFIMLIPGIVFGVMFAVFLLVSYYSLLTTIQKWMLGLLFTPLSGASYYLAFFLYVQLCETSELFAPMLSGLAGSLGLILALWLCMLRKLSLNRAIITVILGSVSGLFLNFATLFDHDYALGVLFVPWQTVVFACLSASVKRPNLSS